MKMEQQTKARFLRKIPSFATNSKTGLSKSDSTSPTDSTQGLYQAALSSRPAPAIHLSGTLPKDHINQSARFLRAGLFLS